MQWHDRERLGSFGEEVLKSPVDIAAASDSRVVILDVENCVQLFSERGEHLFSFKAEGFSLYSKVAFRPVGEQVIAVGSVKDKNSTREYLLTFSQDGELVSTIHHNGEKHVHIGGISVTSEGRIAVIFTDFPDQFNTWVQVW